MSKKINRKRKKNRQGTKLVSKNGRRLWKNINQYLEKLKKELDPIEYQARSNLLLVTIEERKRQRRGLTSNGFRKKIKKKRQGIKLVGKDGRRLWKNINQYLKSRKEELGYFDYITERGELLDVIEERKHQHRGLTTNGFRGIMEDNKIRRMLSNMGYTAEDFAEEYNIPVEEILNENNWDGDEFTCGGDKFEFRFGYNGQNLVRIKT